MDIFLLALFYYSVEMRTSPSVLGSWDATVKNYNTCCDNRQIFELYSWSPGLQGFIGQNLNKTCHMLNGNKKSLGYKISVWNCGRGLLSHRVKQSDKMTDIKLFIQQHNP